METRTLFRAYKEASRRKNAAIRQRAIGSFGIGTSGIATDRDEFAKTWQRYNRLTNRIEARIEGVSVCPLCVAACGAHFSYCRRHVPVEKRALC